MGFHTLLAWIGAVVIIFAAMWGLLGLYNAHIEDTMSFYEYEKTLSDRYRTDFYIRSVVYTGGNLEARIENTGGSRIFLTEGTNKCSDVIIDGDRIPYSSYSTDMLNKTWSPLIWDQGEILNLSINTTVYSGSHILSVSDCDGTTRSADFYV